MLPKPASRIQQFDAMRGIGVVAVMIVHCWWVQPVSPLSAAIRKMLPANFISVDMFFVISGYLITGILTRSAGSGHYFRTFYVRRVLRILPAYYFCLLMLFFVLPLIDVQLRESAIPHYWWMYVLHIQNWLFAAVRSDVGWPGTSHWWSLAVEEQFYLVWPLLVFLVATPQRLQRACVLLIGLCVAVKALLVVRGASWHMMHMSTITRVDCLAAGAFISTLSRATAARYARLAIFAALGAFALILLLVAIQPSDHSPAHTAGITTLAAALFGAITLRIHGGVASGRLLHEPLFIWLGERSYGIYLIHLPIFFVLVSNLQPHPELLAFLPGQARGAFMFAVTLAITLPAAWAMHRYIEMPALGLRHRLMPEKSKPVLPAELSAP